MHPLLRIKNKIKRKKRREDKWGPRMAAMLGNRLGFIEAQTTDLEILLKCCRPWVILKMLKKERLTQYFQDITREETGVSPFCATHFEELQRGFIEGFQKEMIKRLRPPEVK